MDQERVLIAGLTPETGGMESYVMELYRHIDRSRIQFDFLNIHKGQPLAFEEEILSLGGKVFYYPLLRNDPVGHYLCLFRVFKNTHYKAVYYHASKKVKSVDVFRFAKHFGVPLRLMHSHSVANYHDPSPFQKLRELKAARELPKYVTHYFCCSQAAGEWMFGDNVDFKVVKNGIVTEKFEFDTGIRNKVRSKEKADNRTVYGTVARLSDEKNPEFLVDLLSEIHRLQPNSVFWHIGGGELEQEIRRKIRQMGLEESYLMLGKRDNVADYLNAMDLFLLPSLYEGFPIVLVEAQTAGLRCLVSDTVPKEVNITGNVCFLPLELPPADWAKKAVELASPYERKSYRSLVTENGFDITSRTADFERLILG